MFPRSLQCSWTCEIDFLIQEQKLVPQELELDGLEEETPTDKEKKEKEEAENIDEAKKIVEALTKTEGESCKYTLLRNLISQTLIGFYQDWKLQDDTTIYSGLFDVQFYGNCFLVEPTLTLGRNSNKFFLSTVLDLSSHVIKEMNYDHHKQYDKDPPQK